MIQGSSTSPQVGVKTKRAHDDKSEKLYIPFNPTKQARTASPPSPLSLPCPALITPLSVLLASGRILHQRCMSLHSRTISGLRDAAARTQRRTTIVPRSSNRGRTTSSPQVSGSLPSTRAVLLLLFSVPYHTVSYSTKPLSCGTMHHVFCTNFLSEVEICDWPLFLSSYCLLAKQNHRRIVYLPSNQTSNQRTRHSAV